MALIPVNFEYLTGLRRPFLVSARLTGSWNAQGYRIGAVVVHDDAAVYRRGRLPGLPSDACSSTTARSARLSAGACRSTRPTGRMSGASPPRSTTPTSTERTRTFTLRAANQTERYYFTHCRRLGANKLVANGQTAIRFAVWAPNARNVELVRGSVDGELSAGRRPYSSPTPSWRIHTAATRR